MSELQTSTSLQSLGAAVTSDGVHFAIYAPRARSATLAFFDDPKSDTPSRELTLSAQQRDSVGVWRIDDETAAEGTLYAWRFIHGKSSTPGPYLVDPYARAIANNTGQGFAKSIVIADDTVTWNRPKHDTRDLVIYETHARGFTQSPTSKVSTPGTYAGLVEKLPYLQSLGINAIELLPIHECGEHETGRENPETGEKLTNYWGYNSLSFMAVASRYAHGEGRAAIAEFQSLVRACHEAGIEVWADVVFNHTAEGGKKGPTLSFKGIDAETYYLIDPKGKYSDFTGCGNTVRAGHAVTIDLVVEGLKYWHRQLGIDGFRFDLAAVLNRDAKGVLHTCGPMIERISNDPDLADARLIAEAWDLGGGYQVGAFGTPRWHDWNDAFRDDVRRYWRGDPDTKGEFALRITGSPDFYQANSRGPQNGVNFIACHDGFTLRDVVSYNHKHNKANGEKNKDGNNHNNSWNCGVEGPTENAEINELRGRMQRSMLTTVFISLGMPMICGGDEAGRTQQGNNNAYCQDNEISWFDWPLVDKNDDLVDFTRNMIAFRRANEALRRTEFYTGKPSDGSKAEDIDWFDFANESLDWGVVDGTLAFRIDGSVNNGVTLYVVCNPELTTREFILPPGDWSVVVDTASAPYYFAGDSAPTKSKRHICGRKSIAILTQGA